MQRPAKVLQIGVQFNETVLVDLMDVMDAKGQRYWIMVVVDLFMDYNAVKVVKSHDAIKLFRCFEKCWSSWAGSPDTLVSDNESGFAAEQFSENLTRMGTVLYPSAAYAP